MALGKDISGQKFGRLTAIEVCGKYRRENAWLCECSCGKTTIVKLSNLRSGNTRSCGCFQVESRYREHG